MLLRFYFLSSRDHPLLELLCTPTYVLSAANFLPRVWPRADTIQSCVIEKASWARRCGATRACFCSHCIDQSLQAPNSGRRPDRECASLTRALRMTTPWEYWHHYAQLKPNYTKGRRRLRRCRWASPATKPLFAVSSRG